MRFLVAHEPQRLRQQAAASTARWQQGRPLSPLDGVPYAGAACPCRAALVGASSFPLPRPRSRRLQSLGFAPCPVLPRPAPPCRPRRLLLHVELAACLPTSRAALCHARLIEPAVKDGCDALPYPTTTGTGFMAEW